MQFNISINQKAFTEVAPECDIIDAAIFDFIHQFIGSGKSERIEDNGDWYWVSYQKIIDENPILGIKTKSTIYKRVEKLIDANILTRYHKNQEMAKTYFGRGDKYADIIYNRPNSQKNDPSCSKERPPTSEKNDNHSTKDHSTKSYNYGDSEKHNSDKHNINYSSFVDAFNSLYDKNCKVTESKKKNIRSRLRTFTGKEIKQAWENRLQDDWLNGEGSEYMGNWKAAMRNDEKIDNYLNAENNSDDSHLFDNNKMRKINAGH